MVGTSKVKPSRSCGRVQGRSVTRVGYPVSGLHPFHLLGFSRNCLRASFWVRNDYSRRESLAAKASVVLRSRMTVCSNRTLLTYQLFLLDNVTLCRSLGGTSDTGLDTLTQGKITGRPSKGQYLHIAEFPAILNANMAQPFTYVTNIDSLIRSLYGVTSLFLVYMVKAPSTATTYDRSAGAVPGSRSKIPTPISHPACTSVRQSLEGCRIIPLFNHCLRSSFTCTSPSYTLLACVDG